MLKMTKSAFAIAAAFPLAIMSPAFAEPHVEPINREEPEIEPVSPDKAIQNFFIAYDEAQLVESPISKAYRGIRDDDYGKLDDPSDAAAVAYNRRQQGAFAAMRSRYKPEELNANNALSYRLFEYDAARDAGSFAYRHNRYLFDQMNGEQSWAPAFMINIHRVSNRAEAEAYVSRLRGYGPYFAELVDETRRRADTGIRAPDWVYPYVLSDARNVISGAPFDDGDADSPIWGDFKGKVAALKLSEKEEAELLAAGKAALLEAIKPAYEGIIAEMERQQALGPEEDGVWRFADGEAYYAERLRYYTTTNLSADAIHQIGLDNVDRIHGEMRAIMKQVGFDGDLQAFFAHVRESDEFYFDNREDYLTETQAKLDAMQAALPKFFNVLPKAALKVKPVEAFREESAGKAFYQMPAPDGSRPGTYYVNLFDLRDMSRTELEALAFHEGLPGHHLQLSIQTELEGLPPFRKFGSFTAYTEGWGLYAEALGRDMGFYEDPYSDFGRLSMELWRAARLVVDTGIHHKRWSREEAIAYLAANTPNPPGDIEKSIERYIVFPGQATAYMIGKIKIVELRERARAAFGEDFSIADFHDVVLQAGPVPLSILEERVDDWINGEI